MNKNYLRLFIRNYFKFGALNTINLIGLSLGFVAAFLMILYVDHEFSFDSFHENGNQTYRLEAQTNDDRWQANLGAENAVQLMSGAYPSVENIVLYNRRERAFIEIGEDKFPEKKAAQTMVGSAFFEVFDFEFVEGDQATALAEPYSVVLTTSAAEKYFGTERALGQSLKYDSVNLKVTAIIKDLPTHTHFEFSMLLTDPHFYKRDHYHTQAFIQTPENADVDDLAKQILEMDIDYSNEWHTLTKTRLMPIGDIHLYSESTFGTGGKGDLLQIAIFSVLGLLILGIAVINYINMTFAIFLNKGKEVGIRKVLGEKKGSIILSLAYQAILTTFLSAPIIALLLYILFPAFNEFMDVNLWNILVQKPFYAAYGVVFLVVVALLTIVYPTLAMSKMHVSTMIKSKLLLTQSGGVRYRNVLTLFQFALLFTLGISAWFMNQQIQYLDEKDKGFNPENVVKIGNAYELGEMEDYKLLKTKLLSHPQISGVAFGPMMGDGMSPLAYKTEGSEVVQENLLSYGVDIDYFDVMEIDILQGGFKDVLLASADGEVTSLVNQSFINRYEWNDDPIGKKIILRPGTENELNRKVSAVFEDFHFFSFKEKIAPQIISLRPDPRFINTNILIKSNSSNLRETMELIEKEWLAINPGLPVNMSLMDEAVQQMYEKEKQTGTLGVFLSALAIFLSAMGILGFIFYILSLKSKEIAIRKVLGATVLQIVGLLNRQLFITILVAGFIGSIGSYWLIRQWLQEYAYAIEVSPITFLVAIFLVYLAVFGAIGLQTLRSTMINPVLVLKDE